MFGHSSKNHTRSHMPHDGWNTLSHTCMYKNTIRPCSCNIFIFLAYVYVTNYWYMLKVTVIGNRISLHSNTVKQSLHCDDKVHKNSWTSVMEPHLLLRRVLETTPLLNSADVQHRRATHIWHVLSWGPTGCLFCSWCQYMYMVVGFVKGRLSRGEGSG